LNREWLQRSGLPLDKIMQIPLSSQIASVEAMIKALSSGNYSVVLGWIAQDITPDERLRLDKAAAQGQALGLIMRPQLSLRATSRPTNQLKIQSTLYH
jgi:cell division inhibitor SulA